MILGRFKLNLFAQPSAARAKINPKPWDKDR